MQVIKALNNNMILMKMDNGKECICQGKGIGFQKRRGDRIDESLIERTFYPETEAESKHFQELFSEIPDIYWKIAEKVVTYGNEKYQLKIGSKVILPLCDHMAGAVQRYREGVQLQNPILWDTKRVYSKEFQCGMYALEVLKEKLGVEMREDEAAFIAYYFVNAVLEQKQQAAPDEAAKLIGSVIDMVQESFQIKLDVEDWNYQRFLTHLKFFADRILLRQGYEEPEEQELYETLSVQYKHIRTCVDRIADFILVKYHYEISTDERMYLLIHIKRVTKRRSCG